MSKKEIDILFAKIRALEKEVKELKLKHLAELRYTYKTENSNCSLVKNPDGSFTTTINVPIHKPFTNPLKYDFSVPLSTL